MLFLFSFSCTPEDADVWVDDTVQAKKSDLIGVWQTESGIIKNASGVEVDNQIENNTTLSLGEADAYYRNYIEGNWTLAANKITLMPDASFQQDSWDYQVLEFTETTLTLEVKLTEAAYCCNFPEFASNELLTITEVYKRVE